MKRLIWVPLVLSLALASALLDDGAGVRAWWRLRSDLLQADARVESLRAENQALRSEAEALQNDPFAIERAIRQDLELARPGEVVVRVPPSRLEQTRSGNR